MTQSDSESLVAAMLEREQRPVLVLDLAGRIVRANRALHFLLEVATPSHLVKFADWVSPRSREDFLQSWAKAVSGERSKVSLRIRTSAFSIEPVFELVPLMDEGSAHSVMMVMIDAPPSELSPQLELAQGSLYEVSLDGTGMPKRILRALTAGRPRKADLSGPCYRAVHGRDVPCDTCPVRGLAKGAGGTVVLLEASSPFRASLLSARRGQDDVASVAIIPLDQGVYDGMVRARVEALSVRGKLTERERGVLEFLVLGRKLGDFAAASGIATRTAKFHQQNLLRKLGLESREGLFRLMS